MCDRSELIELVKSRPVLWDPTEKILSTVDERRKNWDEIASALGYDVQSLKNSWRDVRTMFTKETEKVKTYQLQHGSNSRPLIVWPYLYQLDFLKDCDAADDSSDGGGSSFKREDDDSVVSFSEPLVKVKEGPASGRRSDNTSEDDETRTDPAAVRHSRKRLNPEDAPAKTRKKKKKSERWKESDRQFLLSLLPHLGRVPESRKAQIRSNLQRVFVDEEMAAAEENCRNIQNLNKLSFGTTSSAAAKEGGYCEYGGVYI